jgi:16S rRNA (adenine1518-N6/adenine1519-N6)-dimethyltransferase
VRQRTPGSRSPAAPPARKRFGQHFLTDRRILSRIADAVGISPGDTVVEIGPGRGALTAELLSRVGPKGRLVAVEVDRDLAAMLTVQYADHPEFTLVEGDVLATDLTLQVKRPFLLAGNIPYNITTPILFRALEPPRAERMVFLVQLEVAQRLVAEPASEDYSALSVNAQAIAKLEIVFRVPAGSFNPPPKVESAVIRMIPRETPDIEPAEEPAFKTLVQALFSQRRKQMLRALRSARGLDAYNAGAALDRARIGHTLRPEVLAPADFARLLRELVQA